MVMLWQGNIFHIINPLWHEGISPPKGVVMQTFDVFFDAS